MARHSQEDIEMLVSVDGQARTYIAPRHGHTMHIYAVHQPPLRYGDPAEGHWLLRGFCASHTARW